jgi:hypothetical protein
VEGPTVERTRKGPGTSPNSSRKRSATHPSGEEVILLLKRLFDERLPILVWFVSADSNVDVKVSGFVNALARSLIVFSDGEPTPDSLPFNRICVKPSSIVEAKYLELKDSAIPASRRSEVEAKYGNSSLTLKLDSGAKLTVFELVRPSDRESA